MGANDSKKNAKDLGSSTKEISVIIPVHNSEKWLKRLIDSLKAQLAFAKLDIIFVNDGSTDKSLEILNSIEEPNIRIINQKNKGVSAARNIGIKNASCNHIVFLDADDYIEEGFFEPYLAKLQNEYDLISSGFIAEYENGNTFSNAPQETKIIGKEEIIKYFLIDKINPNCWSKLFKKDILMNCLFDEKLSFGEDRDMLFRYLSHCNIVLFENCAKYHYCINDTSAMRKEFKTESLSTIEKAEERTKFIQTNYPNLSEYARSNEIDTKCRVLCNIYNFKQDKKYDALCKKLKSDIKNYSILQKKKTSTEKHFLAFLTIRISPKLYVFAKYKLRLQYR